MYKYPLICMCNATLKEMDALVGEATLSKIIQPSLSIMVHSTSKEFAPEEKFVSF